MWSWLDHSAYVGICSAYETKSCRFLSWWPDTAEVREPQSRSSPRSPRPEIAIFQVAEHWTHALGPKQRRNLLDFWDGQIRLNVLLDWRPSDHSTTASGLARSIFRSISNQVVQRLQHTKSSPSLERVCRATILRTAGADHLMHVAPARSSRSVRRSSLEIEIRIQLYWTTRIAHDGRGRLYRLHQRWRR